MYKSRNLLDQALKEGPGTPADASKLFKKGTNEDIKYKFYNFFFDFTRFSKKKILRAKLESKVSEKQVESAIKKEPVFDLK